MYNTYNNNPLFSLLGLTPNQGGGQQQSQMPQQGGGSEQKPQQGGGGDALMELIAAMMQGQNAVNALNSILPPLGKVVQGKSSHELENFVRNEYNAQGADINAAMRTIQQMMQGGAQNNGGGYNTNNGGSYNPNNGGYNPGNNNNNNNNNY